MLWKPLPSWFSSSALFGRGGREVCLIWRTFIILQQDGHVGEEGGQVVYLQDLVDSLTIPSVPDPTWQLAWQGDLAGTRLPDRHTPHPSSSPGRTG